MHKLQTSTQHQVRERETNRAEEAPETRRELEWKTRARICPACGARMFLLNGFHRCPECGFKESCCF